MKIQLSGGTELDTDKLSDKEAAIHEAVNNLYMVCKKFDTSCFVRVAVNGHIIVAGSKPSSEKAGQKDYNELIKNIAQWMSEVTGGRLKVIDTFEN